MKTKTYIQEMIEDSGEFINWHCFHADEKPPFDKNKVFAILRELEAAAHRFVDYEELHDGTSEYSIWSRMTKKHIQQAICDLRKFRNWYYFHAAEKPPLDKRQVFDMLHAVRSAAIRAVAYEELHDCTFGVGKLNWLHKLKKRKAKK